MIRVPKPRPAGLRKLQGLEGKKGFNSCMRSVQDYILTTKKQIMGIYEAGKTAHSITE